MTDIERWRGLKSLLKDAVENGASAIERVHRETARRPFTLLKQVPPLTEPVAGIEAIHDTIVTNVYGTIRAVTHVVDQTLDRALDALDDESPTERG